VKEVEEAAKAHGITTATLKRARASVGAKPEKRGLKEWFLKLEF
jgi:hypothetical protein